MHYRCDHCTVDLGPVIDGEPQPQCADHPAGSVSIVNTSSDEIPAVVDHGNP